METGRETAEARYKRLSQIREPYLSRGRMNAAMVSPMLMPQSDDSNTPGAEDAPQPYQSLGITAVKSLASRLMLILFPTNEVWFTYRVEPFIFDQMASEEGIDPGTAKGKFDDGLRKYERAIVQEFDKLRLRPILGEALEHVLVTGTAIIYLPDGGRPLLFPLYKVVIDRDYEENLFEIIVCERISVDSLDPKIRDWVRSNQETDPTESTESGRDSVKVYTCVRRDDDGSWYQHQEIEGKEVPKSRVTYTAKDPLPWLVVRGIPRSGETYGRSLTELYYADLRTYNGLFSNIIKFAAVASKVLFGIRKSAGSQLSPERLGQLESGEFFVGDSEDIWALQVEKTNDIQMAADIARQVHDRIARGFLLVDGIERQAERVTAEEYRTKYAELQNGLGGQYATLTEEMQLPLVKLIEHRLQKAKKLPRLPDDAVTPAIVTGIEAIGRGNDSVKLRQFLADISTAPQAFADQMLGAMDARAYLMRKASADGIDPDGLVKSEQVIAQEKQDEAMAQMAQNVAPDVLSQQMQQGQQAQPQQGV